MSIEGEYRCVKYNSIRGETSYTIARYQKPWWRIGKLRWVTVEYGIKTSGMAQHMLESYIAGSSSTVMTLADLDKMRPTGPPPAPQPQSPTNKNVNTGPR